MHGIILVRQPEHLENRMFAKCLCSNIQYILCITLFSLESEFLVCNTISEYILLLCSL